MLGRQPVLHVQHGVARLAAHQAAELVVLAVHGDDEAAAMEVDQDGLRFHGRLAVVDVEFDRPPGVAGWNVQDPVGVSAGQASEESEGGAEEEGEEFEAEVGEEVEE